MNRREFIRNSASLLAIPAYIAIEKLDKIYIPKIITDLDKPFYIDANNRIKYRGAKDGLYSVLDLHRCLSDLADQWACTAPNVLDITRAMPSLRYTNELIEIADGYRMDELAMHHINKGSIKESDKFWTSGSISFGNHNG